MSCDFYKYDGGWLSGDYYCIKQKKAVSSDTYYKYCRDYNYRSCPIFKDEDSSGGCFLTSACTAARGLPDDCHELTVLRNYRDNWLKHQPDGILLVAHYYEVAPKIVEAIDKLENRLEIWAGLYFNLVLPCVELIEKEQFEEALKLYRETTLKLEKEYC